MTKRPVPEFRSLDDMAQFFDATSAADLELEEEAVTYEPKRVVLSVRFDPDDMVGLSRLARKYGMDRSTLVRYVIKRFLRQSAGTRESVEGPR